MDFLTVIGFLLLYYIRPQEWIESLESLRPVLLIFILGTIAMVLRDRGFHPRDLFRTPHDWLMLFFFLWMALATACEKNTNWGSPHVLVRESLRILWDNKNLIGFYFIVLQSLASLERIEKFLWYWLGAILLVSILAVGSEYGFDIMDSYRITHGPKMQGRLVLNNGLYRNPNELGHSVIPLIPLIYLFCIWKRPFFIKQISSLLMIFPLYCVYLTQSKGSYLSGAITTGFSFLFGRHRLIQIGILILGLTIGVSLLKTLPRMSELNSPRDEEGIRGRLVAFFFGYEAFRNQKYLGKDNFVQEFFRTYSFEKASHSSYNQIGAELGPPGLFLYLALYFCGFKTLLVIPTRTIQEERIRRVLLAALIAFATSSWMIDFAYHGTFFFLMAIIGAFHRHLCGILDEKMPRQVTTPTSGSLSSSSSSSSLPSLSPSATGSSSPSLEQPKHSSQQDTLSVTTPPWNRLGIKDFLGINLLFIVVVYIWRYIIFQWGMR